MLHDQIYVKKMTNIQQDVRNQIVWATNYYLIDYYLIFRNAESSNVMCKKLFSFYRFVLCLTETDTTLQSSGPPVD